MSDETSTPPEAADAEASPFRASPLQHRQRRAGRFARMARPSARLDPLFQAGGGTPESPPIALHTQFNMDLGPCRAAMARQLISDEMEIFQPLVPRRTVPLAEPEPEVEDDGPEDWNPYSEELDENWSLF